MNKIWNLFTSVATTIILASLVCIITAFGSIKVKAEPDFYSSIDTHVLVPWLFSEGFYDLDRTLWMILLIVAIFFFALNLVACTGKRTYLIINKKMPWKTIIPQFIHLGFFIALIGHLLGSTLGFRSYSNLLYEGENVKVPYNDNLFVRLEGVEVEYDNFGARSGLKTKITLSNDKGDFLTDNIEFNNPVMYRGMVFYYANHGASSRGLNLVITDKSRTEEFSQLFYTNFTTSRGTTYTLGRIFPTFRYDDDGKPYSQADEYLNPYQEIRAVKDGKSLGVGYLELNKVGTSVVIEGVTIYLKSFMEVQYAMLNINKDPGIGFILVGSIILVLGTGMLLVFRRDRAELLSEPAFNKEPVYNGDTT